MSENTVLKKGKKVIQGVVGVAAINERPHNSLQKNSTQSTSKTKPAKPQEALILTGKVGLSMNKNGNILFNPGVLVKKVAMASQGIKFD